ncbi:hypothetical protein CHS0354_026304 [Potamilus streckersoni]|uniref:Mitochondria-eating protein n=1 Tax=Potamilus streckersoni TaxID=2493646 RepID=A0AAE0WB52_9BIVA|nr:hypothetical protein CHS0354_026304 [Potamilus streckersoni]
MVTIKAARISLRGWLIWLWTWVLDHFRSRPKEKSQAKVPTTNENNRNTTLEKQAKEREQKIVSLTKDCKKLQSVNEDLKERNSIYNRDQITLQRECRQLRERKEDLSRKQNENEQQVDTLRRDCSQLRTRNEDLSRQLSESEQQIDALKKDCGQLRTRLSEVASMQLTEGNPNIANLRDQNRPEKLAERLSELYDNQWTDCYQILIGNFKKTEEESIHILLWIVKVGPHGQRKVCFFLTHNRMYMSLNHAISYDICLDRSQIVLTSAKDLLFTVAGTPYGEHDKALDIFVQETLHRLKSFRNKNFKSASSKIGQEIKVILTSTIGEAEVDVCSCFIEECIRICWLMCIKDPPMYIYCDKEAVFDHNKYVPYTKTGQEISYVVWPALFLHRNGPLMRKGVAQGESKKERARNDKVNAANWEKLRPYHEQEY